MTLPPLSELLATENIVHLGAIIYVCGLFCRNQLLLRGLIITGDLVYIIYYFVAPATPLWGAIFWSSMFILVNLTMICLILAERMTYGLRAQEKKLFELLQELTPGQFRQLIKSAQQGEASETIQITTEGHSLDKLYFVLNGSMLIEKFGSTGITDPQTFIGEIAFLLERPATATVKLEKGSVYFVWDSANLRQLLASKPALKTALTASMNRNLANKVAKAGVVTATIGLAPAAAAA